MYKELVKENLTKKIVYKYEEDVFFKALRQRINAYFIKSGLNKQDDPGMFFKTAVQLTMWAGFYACIVSNQFNGWWLLFVQLGFHFTMFLMSVGIVHDGSHSAFSKNPG